MGTSLQSFVFISTILCPCLAKSQVIHVIVDYNSALNYTAIWKPTFIDYLNQEVGSNFNATFEIDFNLNEIMSMDERISEGLAHFYFASPATCSCQEARNDASPMLTIRHPYPGAKQSNQLGGLVVVKSNSRFQSFKDLVGSKIGVIHLADWGSCLMQTAALAAAGVQLFRDAEMVASGGLLNVLNPSSILSMISSGQLDAGFFPSSMDILLSADHRVLAPTDDPSFPFPTSTPPSPDWCLSAFPPASPALRAAVFDALRRLGPADPPAIAGGYAGWDLALGYGGVRLCVRLWGRGAWGAGSRFR